MVRNWYETRFAVESGTYRSKRLFWPWFLVLFAGTYGILFTQIPMICGFILSRPTLEEIANEAVSNPANVARLKGRIAGFYRINSAEVIGATVVLYLSSEKGSYGFVRIPNVVHDRVLNWGDETDGHYLKDFPLKSVYSDPVGRRITGDWFIMFSSYWNVKFGWS